MSNDSRADFEAWYAEENRVDSNHKIFEKTVFNGEYVYMRTLMDYQVWQARDAEIAKLRAENEKIAMHFRACQFELRRLKEDINSKAGSGGRFI